MVQAMDHDVGPVIHAITIMLIGNSGVGKSTMANILVNDIEQRSFPVYASTEATTHDCSSFWFVHARNNITIIDTPGFPDPSDDMVT